ncbi:hypothetical protein SFRURICE_001907 [Spodoptera frugiperda]|nr:hypothetical protein SFRURICE_001907 [Spodoptera frugiperda]
MFEYPESYLRSDIANKETDFFLYSGVSKHPQTVVSSHIPLTRKNHLWITQRVAPCGIKPATRCVAISCPATVPTVKSNSTKSLLDCMIRSKSIVIIVAMTTINKIV